MRREEVLGLRWSDVDDAVHVRQTLTAAQGALHTGPPKLTAGRRDLPMPEFVSKAIGRHRLAQAERLLSLGLPRPELVVTNAIGDPYQPATFSGDWRDFAKAHGFAGITFHGLRHGAATLLLAAGVPDTVAMRTMGHADTRDPGPLPGRRERTSTGRGDADGPVTRGLVVDQEPLDMEFASGRPGHWPGCSGKRTSTTSSSRNKATRSSRGSKPTASPMPTRLRLPWRWDLSTWPEHSPSPCRSRRSRVAYRLSSRSSRRQRLIERHSDEWPSD